VEEKGLLTDITGQGGVDRAFAVGISSFKILVFSHTSWKLDVPVHLKMEKVEKMKEVGDVGW